MSTRTQLNSYTIQHTDDDAFKAAQVVQHDDGGCVVRFGYADTTIRNPRNPLALPQVVQGRFEECHGTPSRTFRTRAGAERAVARWLV